MCTNSWLALIYVTTHTGQVSTNVFTPVKKRKYIFVHKKWRDPKKRNNRYLDDFRLAIERLHIQAYKLLLLFWRALYYFTFICIASYTKLCINKLLHYLLLWLL
ncbi:hypothetical protein XELAEV_18006239mg [Xenopus laevis]|uniref:Uncharacterized protein n=1 Tax=Xenopus laevis TaxID=8355 RepID=A0A974E0R6_XENLA|nr:hypothetical protein XELAEV_18006239mg [Xenopus laevis]